MALHRLTKLMVCLLATTALLFAGGAAGKAGPPAGRQAGGHGTGALPPLPPAAAPLRGARGAVALVLPEAQDQESQGAGARPPLPPAGAPLPRARGTGALPPLPPAAAPLRRARGAVALPQVQGQESHGTGAGPLLPPAATPLPHAGVETITTLQSDPSPAMKLTYEVTKTKYMKFQQSLYRMLTSSGREVENVPELAPQTGPKKQPPMWILITIEVEKPQEAVVLAVRTDNVYIVGFKNAAGVWFAFSDDKDLIKGSTPLPKSHDYRNLVGGRKKLKDLDVDQDAVAQDVRFLSTYRLPSRPDTAHNAMLGTSLGRLSLVVAEAARLKTINATVVAAMDEKGPSRITLQQTKLIVVWGVTSKALLDWKKNGVWNPEDSEDVKEAGIHGAQDAVSALKVILVPIGYKREAEED
ncbi:protein synthesis inhibitor I-like [Triticum urartu]|uniref:Uncharacterized protein n=1 Tax=Triticum urartu TaxID=4572 RepID=A0A8R7P3J5_TRIUA|nr:protein synthesis inhibitor I-like [Triticum urartu]